MTISQTVSYEMTSNVCALRIAGLPTASIGLSLADGVAVRVPLAWQLLVVAMGAMTLFTGQMLPRAGMIGTCPIEMAMVAMAEGVEGHGLVGAGAGAGLRATGSRQRCEAEAQTCCSQRCASATR